MIIISINTKANKLSNIKSNIKSNINNNLVLYIYNNIKYEKYISFIGDFYILT